MTKAELQEKKIAEITRKHVIKTLREILVDPDSDFELTELAKKRLRSANASRAKTTSLSEVKKKYS